MQEQTSETVYSRLREARETAGMTLAEVGEKTGYAVTTLSSVENGHDSPSSRLLEALIDVLRINREWLLTGKGPPSVWRNTHWGDVKTYDLIPEMEIMEQKVAAESLRLKAGELIRKAEILEERIAFSEYCHRNKIELTRKEYMEWKAAGMPAAFLQEKMAARKKANREREED